MRFYSRSVAVVSFFSLLLLSVAAHAIPIVTVSVDVDPSAPGIQSSRNVGLGSSFSVDVVITGAQASEPVGSFAFGMSYNPGTLAATAVTEGPFLPNGFPVGSTDFFGDTSVPGDVFAVDTLLLVGGVAGNGVLATISFDAIGGGTSPLDLYLVELAQITSTGAAQIVPVAAANGSVAVPVPSTLLLMAVGLAGLIGSRRRAA